MVDGDPLARELTVTRHPVTVSLVPLVEIHPRRPLGRPGRRTCSQEPPVPLVPRARIGSTVRTRVSGRREGTSLGA